jgi:hypothetical protein
MQPASSSPSAAAPLSAILELTVADLRERLKEGTVYHSIADVAVLVDLLCNKQVRGLGN